MDLHPLETALEWHDEHVVSLTIGEHGLQLELALWDDDAATEVRVTLTLADATLRLDIKGSVSPLELRCSQVMGLTCREAAAGRVTGRLEILPHDAGYWTIEFEDAAWSLTSDDRRYCMDATTSAPRS